ncbi:hypothetical protein [Streptomyces sp. NPDC049585]|uniref:hypothetical protein n=1 Tax=Streptomyces sp. NPDC049585 TaxID=3155154 RepID=UPI003419941D
MTRLLVEGDADDTYTPWSKKKLADGRYGLVIGKDSHTASDHGHRVICALTTEAIRVGADRINFRDVVLKGSGRGGAHARDLAHRSGHDAAVAYLDRVWDRAKTRVQGSDRIDSRQDAHADLAAYHARVERTPWKGSAGKTDLKNLAARLAVCEKAGGRRHTFSEHHLAEEVGCARETIRNSNERLEKSGHLRKLDSGSPTEGATWLLTDPHDLSHDETNRQWPQAGEPGVAQR